MAITISFEFEKKMGCAQDDNLPSAMKHFAPTTIDDGDGMPQELLSDLASHGFALHKHKCQWYAMLYYTYMLYKHIN